MRGCPDLVELNRSIKNRTEHVGKGERRALRLSREVFGAVNGVAGVNGGRGGLSGGTRTRLRISGIVRSLPAAAQENAISVEDGSTERTERAGGGASMPK